MDPGNGIASGVNDRCIYRGAVKSQRDGGSWNYVHLPPFFVLIMFVLMNCTGCKQQEDMEQFRSEASLFAMNTYMTFTAFGENAQAALTDVKQMVQQSEGLWSVTDENSEIYRANHSNGQTIDISEETVDILSFMFEMAEKTDGALEPTIYPVLTEWGFTTDTKRIPSQGQIEKKLLIARCVAGLFTGLCAGAMLQRGCGVKQKVSG